MAMKWLDVLLLLNENSTLISGITEAVVCTTCPLEIRIYKTGVLREEETLPYHGRKRFPENSIHQVENIDVVD